MDTRTKILTPAAAKDIRRPFTLVTGFFDVLRREHMRELAEARDSLPGAALVAAVLPLAGELLPQRARAELVAGLRVVDYVVITDNGDAQALADALKPARLVRLETADLRRAQQLTEHVSQRQKLQ